MYFKETCSTLLSLSHKEVLRRWGPLYTYVSEISTAGESAFIQLERDYPESTEFVQATSYIARIREASQMAREVEESLGEDCLAYDLASNYFHHQQ